MKLRRTGAPDRIIYIGGASFREVDADGTEISLKMPLVLNSFTDALTKLGSSDGTIIVDAPVNITANTTVPTTTSLIIEKSGSFVITAAKTLTINGYFEARTHTPFSGDGSYVFGAASRRTLLTFSNFTEDVHLKGIIDLEVSFETDELTTHTLYFPFKVTVNKIRSFVTKALAATDDGTITAKNNAGTSMANGVITIAASAAIATEGSASPTTNNVLTADQKLQLTIAKTTAGGRARVTVEFTRTA